MKFTVNPVSDDMDCKASQQVRVLTLSDQEQCDGTLHRLQKGWLLQFRLGPSLFGRRVTLLCNYPGDGDGFERTKYRPLEWRFASEASTDMTAAFAELSLRRPGSFHYYLVCDDSESADPRASGFFTVDPELRFGDGGPVLPLDCVQCQTVLAKSLGPFPSWERKLRVTKESGYNMVHFTPIQELGGSNSSYSLSDQLKLNPIFSEEGRQVNIEDVANLTAKMRCEWKVLSICDIVLNHTANESGWLREHPEGAYNLEACPYLRPAYLLDAALHQLTVEVGDGKWEFSGIPREVDSEEHLSAIRSALVGSFLPQLKIPELFALDEGRLVSEFHSLARSRLPPVAGPAAEEEGEGGVLAIVPDPLFRRLKATVDMELALRLFNTYRSDCFDEDTRLRRCSEDFKACLEQLNKEKHDEIQGHLLSAVENTIAGIRYFRVQSDGPRIKEVSVKHPLVPRYFLEPTSVSSLADREKLMYTPDARFVMAHNGWVMDHDPLNNFAAPGSNVYLRRELIAWGDSVKLRYGNKPEDCPFLWQHMKQYVEETARVFDGVRLDNCHSTPLPVAEYLLDAARKVRPDLYVVAELFTNSDHKDNIFVNRLGITSLIREAMSAWDSHEQGRLVYRYGGEPVGAFFQPALRPLVPSIAHALFLDLTHDNPSPMDKRSVFDLLPSSALVAMACCASGSSRGYDELVPHHIHVVDELRQYAEWSDDNSAPNTVSYNTGIISAKKALNNLHYELGVSGFSQVFVDQMDGDVVAVTRHCPHSHQSVVLVAYTAFSHPDPDYRRDSVKPLRVEGVVDEVILEATLRHRSGARFDRPKQFTQHGAVINGLEEYVVSVREHVPVAQSGMVQIGQSGDSNVTQLDFTDFQPGSVVAIRVSLHGDAAPALAELRGLVSGFTQQLRPCHAGLQAVAGRLQLADLNRALYRCGAEERDDGPGAGEYDIPGAGPLVYCGLQGFMSLLSDIRPANDLGHPMCNNLRQGNWMIDYAWQRLKRDAGTLELGRWLEGSLEPVKKLPRYLVPSYFDLVVTGAYCLLLDRAWGLMSRFVSQGSSFVRSLALGSVQCAGVVGSAPLPALSPSLSPPVPPTRTAASGDQVPACVSLSAGLPHFTTGYMRNWGRDTFIALRGLFILTGRYQEARYHILGYAACLRHGLIPNLLDGGFKPRYNCRDAVWWWLHCVQSYVEEAPNGLAILQDKVSRLFPQDDSPRLPPGAADQLLQDIIQEALSVHFQGLFFRERNAGREIDAHMTDKGFNNQIGVHPETGFVFGGNSYNCGTWMDKMGSSDKAGNRGRPATPRDGSAVELVGLSKKAVSWLAALHEQGKFPYGSVTREKKNGVKITWTYREWERRIAGSFERAFFVAPEPSPEEPRPDLVHRRGIYKDTYGSSQPWADYQLRCNFPVAMVAAPELFDAAHAWPALRRAEELLLGPLGMRTLDPGDWNYDGDYDNSNDSDDPKLAHGFNYHQGPEWVWPLGFFLRARLHFAGAAGGPEELRRTVAHTRALLARHFAELQTSPWRGLPELTNKDGAYCRDSCRTQAWSMGCLLEVVYDLNKIEESHPAPVSSAN
ncbi:glycogen debranching enzyme [Bacillus rossius redtenbacheri]|uniref:glycogen debranching enzyme n=1 Tax=Bacillus rossius redtenbacheri TaxID=93214 RepID=UPI002FDE2DE1